jgi:hypothetical protein
MAMRPEQRQQELEIELAIVLRELNETTVFFHPPEDFDPLRADAEELRRYGIPPRPDPGTEPRRFAFWTRMYSPPLRFVSAVFAFDAPEMQLNPGGPLPAYGTRYESSANWSGAYITPTQDRMFTEVHGSWYVPNASPPPAGGGRNIGLEYRSSTWIGLDGQRRYRNSSLPQIGTAQFVKIADGQPIRTTKAWWQWWMRGLHLPPVTLPLEVHPGDLVMCNLVVIDRTTVRFLIKNQTTGHHVSPFQRHPPSPLLSVSGATAEWVMERPTHISSDRLYPLPDYGTVHFGDCLAVAAHDPGDQGYEQTLPGAKLIDMYEVREQPHRIADISVARREGDQAVMTAFR